MGTHYATNKDVFWTKQEDFSQTTNSGVILLCRNERQPYALLSYLRSYENVQG